MAITALSAIAKLLITQDIASEADLFVDKSVQFGANKTVSVTTGVTSAAVVTQALAAGAATMDLTALTGVNGLAVNGTGLRVKWAYFENPSTNANQIAIAEGAANGYDGFGAAFSLILTPGAYALIFTNDAGSDISGTKKNLDLVGTLVQELTVVLGLG
jgi:hypothetical protein